MRCVRSLYETVYRQVDTRDSIEYLLANEQARPRVCLDESSKTSPADGKGIRLMQKAGDPDSCHTISSITLINFNGLYSKPSTEVTKMRLYSAALNGIGLVPADPSTTAISPTFAASLPSMPISLSVWGMPSVSRIIRTQSRNDVNEGCASSR